MCKIWEILCLFKWKYYWWRCNYIQFRNISLLDILIILLYIKILFQTIVFVDWYKLLEAMDGVSNTQSNTSHVYIWTTFYWLHGKISPFWIWYNVEFPGKLLVMLWGKELFGSWVTNTWLPDPMVRSIKLRHHQNT